LVVMSSEGALATASESDDEPTWLATVDVPRRQTRACMALMTTAVVGLLAAGAVLCADTQRVPHHHPGSFADVISESFTNYGDNNGNQAGGNIEIHTHDDHSSTDWGSSIRIGGNVKGNNNVTTGGTDDHSSTVTLNNRDGMLGFGVTQLESCEGSGKDGHGAGAVGAVCCSSPKGGVACDHGSSGQKDRHVVWNHDWKAATDDELKDLENKGKLKNGKIVHGNGNIPGTEKSLQYLKINNVINVDQFRHGMELLQKAKKLG